MLTSKKLQDKRADYCKVVVYKESMILHSQNFTSEGSEGSLLANKGFVANSLGACYSQVKEAIWNKGNSSKGLQAFALARNFYHTLVFGHVAIGSWG